MPIIKKSILCLFVFFSPVLIFSTELSSSTFTSKPEFDNVNDVIFHEAAIGFDGNVSGFAVQKDGKIIVVGSFNSYCGIPVPKGVARLFPDGHLDHEFSSMVGENFKEANFNAVVVQPDDKIVIGGLFHSDFNQKPLWQGLLRLEADGRPDHVFIGNIGQGVNKVINSISLRPDGKLIIGGQFTSFNGAPVGKLVQLTPDGSLDVSFQANISSGVIDQGEINSIGLQPDGKIVLIGSFHKYDGLKVEGILRLLADGRVDDEFQKEIKRNFFVGFTALSAQEEGADTDIFLSKVLIQPDGKILLAGEFVAFNESQKVIQTRLLRLEQDGKLDWTFIQNLRSHVFQSDITSLAQDSDGNILVGSNRPFARLHPDGTFDQDFLDTAGLSFSGGINALFPEASGSLIVGGYFNSYRGIHVSNLVRLNKDGTLDEKFWSMGAR